MSDDDDFLAHERILNLVGDAMIAAIRGQEAQVASREILKNRQPTVWELEAARSENQSANSGGMPEILRGFVKPPPFDADQARMRREIDDILVAALALLPPSD